MAEYIKRKNNYTKKKKNKIVKDGKTYKSVPSDKPMPFTGEEFELYKQYLKEQQEMGEIEEEEPEGIQLEPFSVPGRIPREEEEKPEFILKEGKWVKNNYAMKKKKKKNNFGALGQYMKRMR